MLIALHNIGMIGARTASVFADSLVLLITWRRTWPVSVDAARSTVSSVLMTDCELSRFADTLQSD